jgi:hypothetical protein
MRAALIGGHNLVLRVFERISGHFSLQLDERLAQLVSDFKAAWPAADATTSQGCQKQSSNGESPKSLNMPAAKNSGFIPEILNIVNKSPPVWHLRSSTPWQNPATFLGKISAISFL